MEARHSDIESLGKGIGPDLTNTGNKRYQQGIYNES